MLLDKVKELAREKNITIAELERKLDFSQGSISRWVKQSPSSERLQKVADYFEVSTDYLLGRTEDRTIQPIDNHTGDSILSHFRLNTADMDSESIEEIEEEINEYMDFLIQRAKAKKEKK
ncbi:hypothetical protein IGK15_001616 [Enterococcus sp. AZ045]|uniref:helix-turn-helix domain-containing protein n=1 Tax=Enterococcus TaxID=1350 RepID=UPI002415136E|nr:MULTISPECIES: helix-turn-helix transcriptional regulator [Enterococcus]MDG4615716.1 helix-turn-helix transcriptional regulator [Enterococcus lactis]MEB4749092.1 helix-turn-helix transcriptional regulator [Enterococcus sp. E5-162]HAQ5734356.1 helix-turn-helix transcriptional regulator [Enterococcus faecium]